MDLFGLAVLIAVIYLCFIRGRENPLPKAWSGFQRWQQSRPVPEWKQKALRERDEALRRQG